jgi:hypothetical protein
LYIWRHKGIKVPQTFYNINNTGKQRSALLVCHLRPFRGPHENQRLQKTKVANVNFDETPDMAVK